MNVVRILGAGALALVATASSAAAQTAVGLVGDNTLVMIDGAKPSVTQMLKVDGVDKLLGIDVRPADKKLYGVAVDGTVVTIDLKTGKTTKVSKLDKMLPESAKAAIVDFNPAADRLRFMGTDGTNLRVDVDTGKVTTDGSLAFEEGDMHKGEKPNVVAAAYSNSFGKPDKTAMYDVDATIGALIHQTKPNDGALKAIGKFGIDKAASYAFDIHTTPDGKNTAWLVADRMLYTVALDSGKATVVGEIQGLKGSLRDIAALPAN